MSTLEEVARFCEPGARRNYHKISLTERLPTTPGVYVMRDDKGAALYIGKAENLRRRTRDHFLQRQAYHARQALELLDRIEVVETGSEFAALLLEERLIARHKPLYNSHGTRVSSYHYVKLSAEEYPRLYATPNLRDDGSYYAGPFRKASLARRFVDCVNGVYPLRTCAHLPAAARGRASAAAAGHACPRAGTGACLAPCSRPLNGEYAAVVGRRAPRPRGRRRRARRAPAGAPGRARAGRWRSSRRRACRSSARRSSARCAPCAACAPRGATTRSSSTPPDGRGWVALWGVRGGAHRGRARGRPRGLRRGRRARPPRRARRGRAAAAAAAGRAPRRDAARALLGAEPPRGGERPRPAPPPADEEPPAVTAAERVARVRLGRAGRAPPAA